MTSKILLRKIAVYAIAVLPNLAFGASPSPSFLYKAYIPGLRAASAPPLVPNSNVKLLVHFDGQNGSKTAIDSSGISPPPSISGGGMISSNSAVFGGSSFYDPDSSFVSFSNPVAFSATDDFTVEYWIKTIGIGGNDWAAPILGPIRFTKFNGGSGSGYGNTSVYTNDLYFEGVLSGNPQKFVISRNGQWNNGQWHHIAVSRANGVLRGFVDGVQALPSMTLTMAYPTPSNTVDIGRCTCNIDEVRITKSVARYLNNFVVPTSAFTIDQ